ncbi:hydroxyacid dehydrogenase [Paracoccus sp. JM45]|uniref:hydroxyacid dehydrogenase n=1 Tax=Paracoccus sp. JM45 TaxID=2283626 RepID=UPI000E6B7EF7|nr:hydroxyacid dehydrogenase [Paracoccus sp. JM45]RJE78823.1 3-phosphoglycerate dehydrogenase [Paracoccus sp. JM45]
MSRIVISEFMDDAAVQRLSARTTTLYQPNLVDLHEILAASLVDAEILVVRNRTKVDEALLDAGTKLRVIGRLGVGLDNIDLQACAQRNIVVWPATGANDLAVAEYVVSSAMMLLRGAYLSSADVAAGDWPRQQLIGRELSGHVMGLLGFGSIARQVAQRVQALGMTVIAHDPHLPSNDPAWGAVDNVSFDMLLTQSDVLSLHVPLTPQTHHIIDRRSLTQMKATAVLINAARGGVVDEVALADALIHGELAGAALDVFEAEPLSAEHGARFAGIRNIILTPHIAGVTKESNVRVSSLIADKILDYLGADI